MYWFDQIKNDFNDHTQNLKCIKSVMKQFSPPSLPSSPSLLMPRSPLSAIFQQLQWVICVEFASATPQWDIFGEKATVRCWPARLEGSRQLLSISVFRLILSVCCGYPDIPGACPPSPTLGSTLIPILLARLQTFSLQWDSENTSIFCIVPKQMTNDVWIWPFSLLFYQTSNLSLKHHFESLQQF